MRACLVVAALGVGAVGLVGGGVRACSIDNVPSLSVNGRLVALNRDTSGADATWTPFVARGVYRSNRALLFHEDRAQVAQALAPVAFRYPWRWRFGDGTVARARASVSVHHLYRRPGSYVVTVEAYLVAGSHRQWYPFDKATIRVH